MGRGRPHPWLPSLNNSVLAAGACGGIGGVWVRRDSSPTALNDDQNKDKSNCKSKDRSRFLRYASQVRDAPVGMTAVLVSRNDGVSGYRPAGLVVRSAKVVRRYLWGFTGVPWICTS